MKRAKRFFALLVLFLGMTTPLLYVAIARGEPSNISIVVNDEFIRFEWEETSEEAVDDYILEFYDGENWNVTPDGVSSNTYFQVPRSAYENTSPITLQMRVTTEFSDESTSDPIEASLTLPAYQKVDFTVGANEEIVSYAERNAVGLDFWVDGNIGFFEHENEIFSVAPNGQDIALVNKGETELLGTVVDANIDVDNQEQPDNSYIAGGPVYYDDGNERLYMFYHAEKDPEEDGNFYSYIGMAYSDDGGESWEGLGQIVTPGIDIDDEDRSGATEIGGGAFAIKDGTFYLYFKEILDDATQVKLSVATADVADVIAAGELGNKTTWTKWNGSDFETEPGISGEGSEILSTYADAYWMDVAYIDSLEKFVMVYSNEHEGQWRNLITTSTDGIHWISPTVIKSGFDDEIRYVSISSADFSMQRDIREDNFYVYVTRSETGGGNRWDDAYMERYNVSFEMPEDYDGDDDGISNDDEDAGPNNGDGNGDGTPDRQQANVATRANGVTGASTTLQATGPCNTITEFSVVASSTLGTDGTYSYPLGLNDFSLTCESVGQTANVTAFYDKTYDTGNWQLRKFMDNSFSPISGAEISTATVGENTVSTVSYSLTDGGSLDEDGAANSTIVDPAGLARSGATDDAEVLADTSSQLPLVVLCGVSLLVVSTALTVRRYVHY